MNGDEALDEAVIDAIANLYGGRSEADLHESAEDIWAAVKETIERTHILVPKPVGKVT